jgi:hypothetical protein
LALDPNSYFVHWHIGYAYAAAGQLDKSITHASFLASIGRDMPYTEQLLALADALKNRPQQALDRMSVVDAAPLDEYTTFHLAEPLMVAGAKEHALDLLEGVVASGFHPYRLFAEYCPFMASLRSEQSSRQSWQDRNNKPKHLWLQSFRISKLASAGVAPCPAAGCVGRRSVAVFEE